MAVQTLLQPKSFTDQVWASCAFQNESARETFREPVWVGVGEGASSHYLPASLCVHRWSRGRGGGRVRVGGGGEGRGAQYRLV